MKNYKTTIVSLLAIILLAGQIYAIGPTPELKKQLKEEGRWQEYLQKRANLSDRGIDMPAPYPPNLLAVRQNAGLYKTATTTYLNALVILVDFSDNPADSLNHPPAEYEDLLFSEGTHPTGSMNDWYLENSYNEVGINGIVTPWVRLPQTYDYYTNNDNGFGAYPMNAQKMTEDAVLAVDSLVDFSQFDNDNDGYVDALFIVHAGPGAESTGNDGDIWSHSWVMNDTLNRDGVTLYGYTTEPEVQGSGLVTMGVFGHEFGHALGLPDLYDTDYSSDGVGMWSMMAGGSWGGGGTKPVHFDAWSKMQMGWLAPQNIIDDSSDVILPPVENSPSSLRMWTDGQAGSEYFLLENRQETGFDVSLPGEGLLIWHIDETVSGNSDDWHKLVTLEQADGNNDLENGNGSDGGDPFPGYTGNTEFTGLTTPNSNAYSGDPSFVGITNIATVADSIMLNASVSYEIPFFSFQGVTIQDFSGNNDQGLSAGETDTLSIALENEGVQLQDATVTLSSTSSFITVLSGTVQMDSIPGNAITVFDTNFVVQVDTAAEAWSMANFQLDITGPDDFEYNHSFTLIVDQGYGFFSQVEGDDSNLWMHYAVTGGFIDEWHVSTNRNSTNGGSQSWRLGEPGGSNYSDKVDAALQTPVLRLRDTVNYQLVFKHYMDAEINEDRAGQAWDGGRVEISTDGGATWSILTPPGGYPYSITNNPDSPFAPGAPAYSGIINWEQVQIPLDDYSGDITIRFRFGSDGYVTEEGWYIDDVVVNEQFHVDIASETESLPDEVGLLPNYPNPFNPETTIPYKLSSPERVIITIYDLRGKQIRTLINTRKEAGSYTVTWDGRDQFGAQVGSGMYFIRMTAGETVNFRKMTLLR